MPPMTRNSVSDAARLMEVVSERDLQLEMRLGQRIERLLANHEQRMVQVVERALRRSDAAPGFAPPPLRSTASTLEVHSMCESALQGRADSIQDTSTPGSCGVEDLVEVESKNTGSDVSDEDTASKGNRMHEDKKIRVVDKLEALKQQQLVTQRGFHTVMPKPSRNTSGPWVRTLIQHKHFEAVVVALILANAVLIGAEAHWGMQNLAKPTPPTIRALEVIFTVIFLLELLLRIRGEGRSFVSVGNKNFAWNFFDSLIVASSILEEFLDIISASAPDLTAFRLLRVTRLVRVIRVIRVMRFFRDLRVMVQGVLGSAKSLSWAIMLLVLVKFTFAVVVLQVASQELSIRKQNPSKSKLTEEGIATIHKHFSSLMRTIYTLWMSVLGGIDWGEAAEPLINIHAIMGVLFSLYVAFAILCVLNIITGLFVENATKLTIKDEDSLFLEELEMRQQWYMKVQGLFSEADLDGDGYLSWPEFKERFQDSRVQAIFRKVGIDIDVLNAGGLFRLLDFDGEGVIDLDGFATSLQQLQGSARSIEIARLRHETLKVKKVIDEVLALCIENNKDQGYVHVFNRISRPLVASARPPEPPASNEAEKDFTLPGTIGNTC